MKEWKFKASLPIVAMLLCFSSCGRDAELLKPPPAQSLALVFINREADVPDSRNAIKAVERAFWSNTNLITTLQLPGGGYYGMRIEVDDTHVTDSGITADEAVKTLRRDSRLDGFEIFIVYPDAVATEIIED